MNQHDADASPHNSRRFNRVRFQADALLKVNNRLLECEVLDLSLHGARIKLQRQQQCVAETPYQLQVLLGFGLSAINLRCQMRFQSQEEVGFEILDLDIDSATRLRRLLELNLGDPKLIERDINALLFS